MSVCSTFLSNSNVQVLPVQEEKLESTRRFLSLVRDDVLKEFLLSSGGIVYQNWIRLYGTGSLSVVEKNAVFPGEDILILGEDVIGGLFGYAVVTSEMYYFEPDSLEWMELEGNFEDFLFWLQSDLPADFYQDLRWQEWQQDCASLGLEQGISFDPPLWLGDMPLRERKRCVLLMSEILEQELDAACSEADDF